MAKKRPKTVEFSSEGIAKLPKDKPVVYRIKNQTGVNIYTGKAKRGRVEGRLEEHLPGAVDPILGGKTIKITQINNIDEAEKLEKRIIAKEKPKFNKKGK